MKEILNKRRQEFFSDKKAPYIAVLFSGIPTENFNVNRNFYYYTNLKRENMILVMAKLQEGMVMSRLFIEPYDEWLAKWVGGRMKKEEASQLSGINQISYIEDFSQSIKSMIGSLRGKEITVGLDLWTSEGKVNPALKCSKELKESFPQIKFEDIYSTISRQRVIKSEDEIEKMRVAQEHTRLAIEAMMKHARPEMNESELEGAFDFELKKHQVKEYAFQSIVAGGKRATILHYSDNNQVVHDGELVLIDLGSSYQHYCADISRTFPVNGKFTERQKEVYNAVLEIQDEIINTAKPGMTLKDLNDRVISFYEKKCDELGLLKNGKTVRDYYYHSVSHQLGLDCHDVGDRGAKLEPGMVITVEPGLYIEEESIGVRIENDILITKDKAIDLSANILKTVEDIENLMKR